MNRFEKKCFIGSAGFHGLLLLAFVFGSAFMAKDTLLRDMGRVVTMENIKVTDGPTTGGGNPNANPNPPPQQNPKPVEPTPPVQPPKAEKPPEQEPVRKPEPKPEVQKKPEPKNKETPKKELAKGEIPVKPSTKDKSIKSDISTTVVTRTNNNAQAQKDAAARTAALAAKDKADREAWERYSQQRAAIAKEVGRIAAGAGKGLTHSTVVEAFGPGGEAFVNYGSLVREIYDRAWMVSPDLADDDSSAVARIVIRRDGTVSSAVINKPSANASLNKSVRRALDAVREIGKPFPEGAKELERTFNIEFNLKTRRAAG